MLYRFTGQTARFYPDERGPDGKSLMAMPGDTHDWERTPDDGLWVPDEAAPAVPDFPADPAPGPVEPAEAPVPMPVPMVALEVPEPPAEPVAAPGPVPQPIPFIQ